MPPTPTSTVPPTPSFIQITAAAYGNSTAVYGLDPIGKVYIWREWTDPRTRLFRREWVVLENRAERGP